MYARNDKFLFMCCVHELQRLLLLLVTSFSFPIVMWYTLKCRLSNQYHFCSKQFRDKDFALEANLCWAYKNLL